MRTSALEFGEYKKIFMETLVDLNKVGEQVDLENMENGTFLSFYKGLRQKLGLGNEKEQCQSDVYKSKNKKKMDQFKSLDKIAKVTSKVLELLQEQKINLANIDFDTVIIHDIDEISEICHR